VARYPNLAKRSLVVYSFGKTFHNTGWKMGYICAPSELTAEVRKVHQYNVFSVNTPIQYALAEYMCDSRTYAGISEMYEAKRDVFNQALQGSRFAFEPAAGAYFQLLDYSAISDEGDVEFAKRLTWDDDELLHAAEILKSI
jgi:methionine aminotransferase